MEKKFYIILAITLCCIGASFAITSNNTNERSVLKYFASMYNPYSASSTASIPTQRTMTFNRHAPAVKQ